MVFLPIASGGSGGANSTRNSCAAERNKPSALTFRPGAIAEPTYSPAAFTPSKIVIGEKSITIAGEPCKVFAASALATRSEPTSRGLSVRILIPVFTPGPTTSGVQPKCARHNSVNVGIIGGTDEANTPPLNGYAPLV